MDRLAEILLQDVPHVMHISEDAAEDLMVFNNVLPFLRPFPQNVSWAR